VRSGGRSTWQPEFPSAHAASSTKAMRVKYVGGEVTSVDSKVRGSRFANCQHSPTSHGEQSFLTLSLLIELIVVKVVVERSTASR